MSRYRITIDGRVYEMDVELMDGPGQGESTGPAPLPSSGSSASDVRVIDPSARKETHLSDGLVTSPMPGTVTSLHVGPGDAVAKGQTVLILEAMKMENDIVAPKSGTIARLHVAEGQTVQGAAPLFEMA